MDQNTDKVKLMKDYPSNAHGTVKKVPDAPKKEVKKVISGVVKRQKKSLGRKFLDVFLPEDIGNVKGYIIHDVLIPAAKNMLYEMITGGSAMTLFGEKKGRNTARVGGSSYVSYNSLSSSNRTTTATPQVSAQNRARHNFDDLPLPTRGDAEEVLSNLVDLIEEYGEATVSDLYDLMGVTGEFTDTKYGWTNLSGATATRTRSGEYILNLPRTIFLK